MTLHHLSMTTARMAESRRFYDAVLCPLGYTPAMATDRLSMWHGPAPEILLWPVEGEDCARHTFGRPGWHHAAFLADDRDTVQTVHSNVTEGGWTVVHEPREYPEYAEGYFAVFVEDPDGLRIEVAHIPGEIRDPE
ncbi:VOC family protein [Streptomyces sp. BK340]|uniref:VOC family protein n=1 Tax=Streptomyces sp. BK340 TaxID=2572903 RepID=UPI0011AB9FB3|nr:VOC family protein [Streptomyces sp. BK340]TVZ76731.1 catechol 2,3-dioxygenase-like lactoylglutathione lyase family enzyme [Streptomyces sp. BK340]